MFRITLVIITDKTDQIADSKAAFKYTKLVPVNAIIISIALSTLIPKILARNAHLVIPSF